MKLRKFEKTVAEMLTKEKHYWAFEALSWKSKVKVPGNVCLECGASLVKLERYTPDFVVSQTGYSELEGEFPCPKFVIEVKGGSFTAKSQARIKRFFKQHGSTIEYVIVARTNVRLKNLKGNPTILVWGDKWNIPVVIGVKTLAYYLEGVLND